jgi:hypothetical protein
MTLNKTIKSLLAPSPSSLDRGQELQTTRVPTRGFLRSGIEESPPSSAISYENPLVQMPRRSEDLSIRYSERTVLSHRSDETSVSLTVAWTLDYKPRGGLTGYYT